MNACGDFYGDDLLANLLAAAATVGAVIFDHRSATATVGARRNHAKHSAEALLRDATLSAALHADGGRCSGLCARAVALFAGVLLFKFDRAFGAGGNFLK